MPELLKANVCPACEQESNSIKLYNLESTIFFGVGMMSKSVQICGCRACVRPQLKKFLWKHLLLSNIIWPFLVLPTFIYCYRNSGKSGHSPKWIELVHSYNEAQVQAELEEQEEAKREKPKIDHTHTCRHRGGTIYHSTGGIPGPKMLLLLASWAVIGIPVFSFIYAAAEYYCPEMTLKVCIIPIAYVALHGYILKQLARYGNCRDELGLRFAAIFLGAWNLYLSWVCWIFIVSGYKMLIMDPTAIWNTITYLAKEQFWQGDRGPKSTIEHAVAWSLEAIIFIAVPAGIVWNHVRKNPFCESCLKKLEIFAVMKQRELPRKISEFKLRLSTGDLSELANLPLRQSPKYLTAEVRQCSNCKDDFVVTVTSCEDTSYYNNTFTRKNWIVPPMYCDPEEVNKIIK